eukprot:3600656-Prymnesium_polylepis.1
MVFEIVSLRQARWQSVFGDEKTPPRQHRCATAHKRAIHPVPPPLRSGPFPLRARARPRARTSPNTAPHNPSPTSYPPWHHDPTPWLRRGVVA